jgi:hypothetical protein
MIVISLVFDHAPAALANHRRYARMHAYRHVEIDMSELAGSRNEVRWVYKYEALLLHLTRAEPGEPVLLLSENGAILQPAPLPDLMEGRDWLLSCGKSGHPQTDIQFWRNTDEVRRKLLKVVTHCRYGVDLPEHEGQLLCEFEALPAHHLVRGLHVAVPGIANTDCVWAKWPAFGVAIADEPHHRRFRTALLEHINDRTMRGLPLLSTYTPHLPENTPRSIVNPGQPLAIVMLYTPNIARYGRIAEVNFRRYCERHGYTLYVHREIPAHLHDGKTSGNWLKPALLREVMPHHEWVFWVDADVLFNDMYRRLETIVDGRDAVFARDVGYWRFNSGVMGFRCTQTNFDALQRILDACAQVDDKSSVYANRGDQFFFVQEFGQHDGFDPARVSSMIDWNTPWTYRRPDSFMVHYIGIWEDHKALLMDYDLGLAARE